MQCVEKKDGVRCEENCAGKRSLINKAAMGLLGRRELQKARK